MIRASADTCVYFVYMKRVSAPRWHLDLEIALYFSHTVSRLPPFNFWSQVHFKSAALINPSSSVLHCYIAMTLHKQGAHDRALVKLKVGGVGSHEIKMPSMSDGVEYSS